MKIKKIFSAIYGIFIVATILFILSIDNQPQKIASLVDSGNFTHEFIHGQIKKIMPPLEDGSIPVTVKINEGKEKGKTISAPISPMNNFNTYNVGEEIQIYKMTEVATGNTTYEIADFYHTTGLIWIFFIFAGITFIIARKKGLTAILSVIVSLFLFYFIFLRMIIDGYSPVIACLVFILTVTIVTIPLIHGFNKKSLSAIIAIILGYAFSLFISYLFRNIVQLGNAPGEEYRMLGSMYPDIGLSDILIASIFLGAVGALIDTAISIASAMFEAIKDHSSQTFSQVYKTGMAVGKDILGSMVNTLLFAYLASALPFLILTSLSDGSNFKDLINMDFLALELTRTFIGAISLVMLIPVTASISAYFLTKKSFSRS